MLREILRKILQTVPYRFLDAIFTPLDKKCLRRTRNIRLIPSEKNRRGGKHSYAEWAYVIGIFQALMFIHLAKKENNLILDVGCGTGLLGIASEPFLGESGRYVGIDIVRRDIEFCRNHYPRRGFQFIHLDINNPAYAPSQESKRMKWNLDSDSFDLVTALSVWTHLNEPDAFFYLREIHRVLKPNSKAILTFFVLDELYVASLPIRSHEKGRYHMTLRDQWIFDQPAYGSKAWFYPHWAQVPETAIGVTKAGLNHLLADAKMEIVDYYHGNWKEVPGLFFQDVLVLQKKG